MAVLPFPEYLRALNDPALVAECEWWALPAAPGM